MDFDIFLLKSFKFCPRAQAWAQGLGPSGSHGGRAAVRTTVGRRNGPTGAHGPGPWAKAHGPGPWALAQSPFTDHAENYFSEIALFQKRATYLI